MLHHRQHIADLAEICHLYDIAYVVISPGSRNAPVVEAFYTKFGEKCLSVVDERSAGYVAIGLARNELKPVVLICTSGTAVLNYSPAIAEAYYQRIPLIVVTADRPPELIDQQDNQAIRQENVYGNFIRFAIQLKREIKNKHDIEAEQEKIKSAINNSVKIPGGPVHINVPLAEPLYENLPEASDLIIPYFITSENDKDEKLPAELISTWNKAEKIMILLGQLKTDHQLNDSVKKLVKDNRVVLIAENISNVHGEEVIRNTELLFAKTDSYQLPLPDLIIYAGGQIVSKRIKSFLRKASFNNCWRIGKDDYPIDTFHKSNLIIPLESENVFKQLAGLTRNNDAGFKKVWEESYKSVLESKEKILADFEFCELKAMEVILNAVPESSILELGNSSIIRYSQLFKYNSNIIYYSNRGVSGIDGCLSAAVGTAIASGKLTIVLLGDTTFIYDSNALWNKQLPSNLKIIVFNNHGGGIFSLIDGPTKKPFFKEYLEAYHPVQIKKLVEAFNLNYFYADDEKQLNETLSSFLNKSERSSVLEIVTNKEANIKTYKKLMNIHSEL
ncbi:MAG: 2-succinyl-5-enolpyruvyl-6-hydroxy-3-cyclohexene-1-carboxylic-acid synthase [Bacteroidales bacterium]|nr:2-succinyl-5-enolpyruvyl-6-hydroxy-3-cyclohexene-1-carboxylic-acid synthase [Bacteroidales bacterium]